MPWWFLLIFVFFAWCLWAVAALAQRTVRQAKQGVLAENRGGMSIGPVIPLFPLSSFGIAKLLDVIVAPWGTWSIVILHGIMVVACTFTLVRDLLRLRSLR